MTLSDRQLDRLAKLAQLVLWAGVGLLLVSIISWQLTKMALGGTTLLNWAAGLLGVGIVGDCTARTIKMKRRQREG
ncbi:hypothetical protein [Brevundimonas fluminis]|jgi:hypothetical protein|uniref:hypothetical protein n=1 Tax=Brevundimonas fluminis TaxID=2487274 RepID=UPI000F6576D7|nr:hypothetical protein [Brevundimonas fluminis]